MPLTLLGLRPHHDYAVVEMGMRGLGQIAYLCSLAEPHVGVVVNAGIAHVGVVGSVDDIARGKSEIFAGLPGYGAAVLPAGDPRLAAHAAAAPRRITFGEEPDADVRLVEYHPIGAAGADVVIAAAGASHRGRVPLPGRHNAINACCAVAAALAVGVPAEVALAGIAGARPAAMRGEVRTIAGRRVLVDCYNANPAAMQAALATLVELAAGGRAAAVLGDMLELGDQAPAAHRRAGQAAAELGVEVIALGALRGEVVAGAAAAGGRAAAAADPADAARRALAATAAGDWLLVKGSRGMRLERVLEAMESA
ncbi:MAG TPA: Mur ligase family protein [Kofleriaceae bacterium]|nr:Mur ligase family protein [Kofleriaceae bacterium]